MGIPLRGREFTPQDSTEAPPVAIISAALAERYFPNQDPIGRTLMQDWHRSLGLANGGLTWAPITAATDDDRGTQSRPGGAAERVAADGAHEWLRTEGTALHHCVASYAERCWRGASRIWSLRVRRGEKIRQLLTVEVDMNRRAVVQARGWGNRAPSGKPLLVLHDWAVRERVRLAI